MAEHSPSMDAAPAGPFDMQEHRRTYHRFLGMCKWGSIAGAITLVILFFLFY